MTERIHDGLGASDCVGSGYMIRRTALEDIGNFPTFSVSEDTACSSLLVGHGWGVAYIEEPLQCGEKPETTANHIKQRTRWTIGNIQTAFRLNFRLFRSQVRKCSIRQRLAGFVFGCSSFVSATLAIIGFLGMPLVLLSGYSLIVYGTEWQLKWLLRQVSVWVFSDFSHKAAMSLFVAYRDAIRWDQADQWLIPLHYTVAFIRIFLLPRRLSGTKPGFLLNRSLRNDFQERNRLRRPSPLHRIKSLFFGQFLCIHFLFIYLCILGFSFNVLRIFSLALAISSAYGYIPSLPSKERWIYLLTRVGWPPLFWLLNIVSCWFSLAYMVNTPKAVKRDDVLYFDRKAGVRRVRDDAWGPKVRVSRGWSDYLSTVILLYTVVCFWGSWNV